MKIKIVRRFELYMAPEGCEEEVYDIYQGFGFPFTFPFCTRWYIEKAGLSRDEALKHLETYLLDLSAKVIIDC